MRPVSTSHAPPTTKHLPDPFQGFDGTMNEVLRSFYPKALMSELALYSHRALADLQASFPNSTSINVDNLYNLGQVSPTDQRDA